MPVEKGDSDWANCRLAYGDICPGCCQVHYPEYIHIFLFCGSPNASSTEGPSHTDTSTLDAAVHSVCTSSSENPLRAPFFHIHNHSSTEYFQHNSSSECSFSTPTITHPVTGAFIATHPLSAPLPVHQRSIDFASKHNSSSKYPPPESTRPHP